MSGGAGLKKRQVPKVATSSTTNSAQPPSTARARTVTRQEASEWQLDSEYILSGYRPEKADYLELFASLTFLHNKTCNVYTHLVGAILLPLVATVFLRYLGEPQFLNVSSADYAMFGIYFWCAEICLLFSALYHLLQPHSYRAEQVWHAMDLLGIVVVTVGTFASGIYYVFFCEASLQKLHWAIVLTTGTATGVLISNPSLRTLRWRRRYRLEYMLQYSGMKWYLLELVFYGAGVSLYAFRIPERLPPGRFDIWGSSHQIFHVAILFAMYTHVTALLQGFTSCHTLDPLVLYCTWRALELRYGHAATYSGWDSFLDGTTCLKPKIP
ncbi:hemolysin-III protein [Lasiosphaeria miniovina]|uniref:Hemolysin-III protein n=1 Tax=Lasiosphaeria miniovina TaxID=1954250 RepID=A0AA40E4P7_9PEZI|nr:hemolysin-III protein [Lasiosphaeria miniovina]KAK0728044.1 hemolysin-III protein [Lasiosphaeria miniovina]